MGAQPRRLPPGAPKSLCLMTTESHYSSLSCKQLSTALTRATEECRELSPPRGGRGAVRAASGGREFLLEPPLPAWHVFQERRALLGPGQPSCPLLPSRTRVPRCSGSLLHGDNETWVREVALLRDSDVTEAGDRGVLCFGHRGLGPKPPRHWYWDQQPQGQWTGHTPCPSQCPQATLGHPHPATGTTLGVDFESHLPCHQLVPRIHLSPSPAWTTPPVRLPLSAPCASSHVVPMEIN